MTRQTAMEFIGEQDIEQGGANHIGPQLGFGIGVVVHHEKNLTTWTKSNQGDMLSSSLCFR